MPSFILLRLLTEDPSNYFRVFRDAQTRSNQQPSSATFRRLGQHDNAMADEVAWCCIRRIWVRPRPSAAARRLHQATHLEGGEASPSKLVVPGRTSSELSHLQSDWTRYG
ncbi:hypothetical protein G7046_g3807 [Stylonectria norvegica]|nr:hypothetical protein G7046_g3807 [Stylonectria norvegica]